MMKAWLRASVQLILVGSVLFGASGRFDWFGAWAYVALSVAALLVTSVVMLRLHPDLIAERSRMQPNTAPWDRVLAPLMALVGPVVIYLVAALDARWGWTERFPPLLLWLGVLAVGAGGAITLWAMAANRFFSTTVRIQSDRGHSVMTGGPYRLVRHPGYVGMALFHGVTPLVLQSWYALIPGAIELGLIVLRTALEDRMLQADLPGYREYAQRTRHRLVPGIW